MQEKERYEIHMYDDCKVALYDNSVLDKSITDKWGLGKLLNQQDARIKELEEQLSTATMYYDCEALVNELKQENQQLKQSQKELEISELEKLKDFFLEPYRDEAMGTEFLITTKNTGKIADYVLDRIKSLKEE